MRRRRHTFAVTGLAGGLLVACAGSAATPSNNQLGGAGGIGEGGSNPGGNGGASSGGAGGGIGEGGSNPGGNGGASSGGTSNLDSGSVPLCGATMPSRGVQVRLDPPSGVDASTGAAMSEDVSGTLTAVVATHEACSAFSPATAGCVTNALRMAITTPDAQVWSFVIASASVDEWVAPMTASTGTTVSLAVRHARGFQFNVSSGFVLSNPAGILMAAETGPFVATLLPADLPSFHVTLGADLCRSLGSCGSLMVTALVFHGDASVSVDRANDGEFLLHSLRYGARNSGGGYPIPDGCSDFEHVSTWVIWRKSS